MYGPLGYSGTLNILGMVAQLLGFVLLLTQFQDWIKHIGKKIGDQEKEITATNKFVTKWGIIFVVLGTASQLGSALINAYVPGLFSNVP